MRRNIQLIPMLLAVLLLCGFTWNFGSDPCKEALDLSSGLVTMDDQVMIKQTESRILSLCPDGAPANFIMGQQLERVGNLDGALAEYRKALQIQPVFPAASGSLGMIYYQKGMNDEASVELAKGLSTIQNPLYHKAMGRILGERKVFPLAIYHYSEAAKGLTRDSTVNTGLAEVYLAMGAQEKAVEEYRRAITVDPGNVSSFIGLANILVARNELDRALEELKKGEASNPQDKELHLLKGKIYEKKGDAKQAEYEFLLGGKPRSAQSSSAPSEPAPAPVSGDIKKAIEDLKAAIKGSPDSLELYEKLGHACKSAGMDDDAIAAYREAAHRNSKNSDTYLNLAILYEKRSMTDEAVVAYKQAIKVNPDNADARLRLAEIRLARGFIAEAVEHFTFYLKIKPESPDIHLKLARLFARTKEYGLAIESYLAVLKYSPDNADANREIAAIYRSRNMNEKAIEHYRKALDQQKDDMETRNALVAIYVKNKQYDEITEILKTAVELHPDDPNNHYKLGLIYDFKKDYENASASYIKAKELKPDHARALNALGRLYMKTGRLKEARETLEAAKAADPNLEETSVLLNNIKDEFSPEPRTFKKSKAKKSKKAVKGKDKGKANPKADKKKTTAKKAN